jgi:hypothetical protein
MSNRHTNSYWKIEGFDGTNRIFHTELAFGAISETGVISFLQRLASRHLDKEEVVAASLRRNARAYCSLLHPSIDNKSPGRYVIRVGENPHYVAAVRQKNRPR